MAQLPDLGGELRTASLTRCGEIAAQSPVTGIPQGLACQSERPGMPGSARSARLRGNLACSPTLGDAWRPRRSVASRGEQPGQPVRTRAVAALLSQAVTVRAPARQEGSVWMSRPQDKSNGLPTEGQAAQQGTQAAGPGTTAGAAATGTAGTRPTAAP